MAPERPEALDQLVDRLSCSLAREYEGLAERMVDPAENQHELFLAQQQLVTRDREIRKLAHQREARRDFAKRTLTRPRLRTRGRESHARRPGHRRVRSSTRAGPDDPPGEHEPAAPRLALAPRPAAIYSYAASHCPTCGSVLLWSDGRLVCASRSCPRWGRPA